MRSPPRSLLAAFFLIFFALACHRAPQGESPAKRSPAPPAASDSVKLFAYPSQDLGKSPIDRSVRKLFYTARIRIEVASFRDASKAVETIGKEAGGYVADSSSQEGLEGKLSGTVVLRIPEPHFAVAVGKLKSVGKLKEENSYAQDVTEEYTDLEARLKNKKELEARLLSILEVKAARLGDVLEVEREMARVREEIESLQGRKHLMDDQLRLATVTVDLFEPDSIVSSNQWAPLKESMGGAIEMFSASLGGMLLFLVGALPWLFMLTISFLIVRHLVRRRRAKGPASPQ